MKKIVGILRPFDKKQNFFVYEDGNRIDKISITLDELNNSIIGLSEKYNAYQVDLTGPKQYVRGLVKKLEEAEMTKYNKLTLTINFI